MKKLTAGIFTVLIGLCAANSADAAIASKAWVEQDFATKTSLSNEKSALQASIDLKANAADVYTKDQVYTKTESDGRFDVINAAQNALKSAQDYTDAQLKTLTDQFGSAGDGEGEGTGLAGTVAGHTIQIGALESKVGDTAVATQITNALSAYTNTQGMNDAINAVAGDLAEHEKLASETYATIANLGTTNENVAGLTTRMGTAEDNITALQDRMVNEIAEGADKTKIVPSVDFMQKAIDDSQTTVGTSVQANTRAITALTTKVNDNATTAANETKAVADDLAAYKTSNSAAVSANTDAIAAINNAENGILKQATTYTDAEIDKLEQSLTGTSTNLEELSKTVTTNTENIGKNAGAIAAEEARARLAEEANAAAAAAAQAQADKGVTDAKAAAEAAAANAKTLADQALLISANSDNIATNAANIQTNAGNIAANTAKFGNYTETKDLSILAKENIPTVCSDPTSKCVLTYGTDGFEWEVVERETVAE